MQYLVWAVRTAPMSHKLRYSKTVKGESWAALLGLAFSLVLAYFSLCTVGACSVDLKDLYTLGYYLTLTLTVIY